MPASGLHLLFLDPSSMRIWASLLLTSWLVVNIQLRANLGRGSGPGPGIWLVGGDPAPCAWPQPCPGPHEVQQPGNQLPCAQGADALRTGASEEPTVALPWGTLAWKCPSTWPLAFSPHYVLLSGHPSQPCSGHPCEPIFCQTLRPLSLKAIHGLGLHTPGYRYKFTGTLEEDSPRAQHSHAQVAHHCAQAAQLHQAWAWVRASVCVLGASPLTFATPPRVREQRSDHLAWSPAAEASPAVPAGGPLPQGGAQLAFAPAPGASGLRWHPLRAARLHANGPLPPAFLLASPPPRARPAPSPARRKSLNW